MSSILDFKVTLKDGAYVSLVDRMRELGFELGLCFSVDGIVNRSFLPPEIIFHERRGMEILKEEADEAWLLMHVHGNSFCEVVKRDLMEQIRKILINSGSVEDIKDD